MGKKVLAAVLVMTMVLCLAACGGTGTAESGTSIEPSTPGSEVAADAGAANGDQSEVITVWECNNGDENYEGALQKLAQMANEANIDGQGYQVEATMISWNGYHETFMSAAMANAAPDIACEASTAPFLYHGMGMALDLTPIYDQWVEEGSGFINQIDQNVWDYMTDENGVLYALPYGVDGAGFFYNKSVFAEAGINELPATWDDLWAACEKISAIGKTPIVCSANINKNQTTVAQMFMNGNTASNLRADFTSAVLDDKTQETYKFVADLYEIGYIGKGVVGYSLEDAQRLLLDGEAGMTIAKSPLWCPEDRQDDIGVMNQMKGPSTENPHTGCSFQAYYCFNQGGHDDATRAVMKWWIENNDILWSEGHSTRIPIRKEQMDAVIGSELVKEFASKWPLGAHGVPSIWPLTRMQPFTSALDAEATDGIVATAIFAGEDWHEASEYANQRINEIIGQSLA